MITILSALLILAIILFLLRYYDPIRRTLYTILKNGEAVFTDLSQNEYFDRMQDFAVEFYLTGKNDPSEFTTKMTEEEPD